MLKVNDIVSLMQDIAPNDYAMMHEYDNVGLLFGSKDNKINKVLVCLDVTKAVVEEAIKIKAGLILSHHPFIYMPIKSIVEDDVLGAKIIKLAKNDISVLSCHTNLDFVIDGINDYASRVIGIKDLTVLDKYIDDKQGLGRVGNLEKPITLEALRQVVKKEYKDDYVRMIGDGSKIISRVAVINGAGGGDTKYIDMAISNKADCLVTADLKHHIGIYAYEKGLAIIEPQHYNMEHIYLEYLIQRLQSKCKDAEFILSKDTNPRK